MRDALPLEVHNELCAAESMSVHVHSLHTSFGVAAQTQKPREFVSRNEKLDDDGDNDDDSAASSNHRDGFRQDSGNPRMPDGRTDADADGGLFVRQLNSVRGRTYSLWRSSFGVQYA